MTSRAMRTKRTRKPMPNNNDVTIEEVLDRRKDFSNEDGILFKASVSPKSWDEDTKSATFIMSAETEDRHRDVVVQEGINLEQFNKNPIAFFNHRSWETPIGSWDDVKTVNGRPKRTEGRMVFCEDGVDENADKVARHVAAGTLRAASIGFRPLKMSRIEDDEGNWTYGYKFDEVELYECSVVTVPAVREALIKGAGNISEIISPEVVEEFLEHLKENKAVAELVNKELFEQAYRSATGNKQTVALETSVQIEGLDEFRDLVKRAEVARSEAEETTTSTIEQMTADLETKINSTLEEFADDVDADDEKKSAMTSMIERIKSVFTPKEEKPKLASDEAKSAVGKKLKELEIDLAI